MNGEVNFWGKLKKNGGGGVGVGCRVGGSG